MPRAAALDAVMRTLADPTRRAVFERIVRSGEITVVELTHGSGVTQGASPSICSSLKQAGLVAERAAGPQRLLPRRAEGPRAAGRLDEPLRRLLARPLRRPPNPPEGNRSMNDAALKTGHAGDRGRRGLPACAGDDLEDADHRRADRPLADGADRVRAGEGQRASPSRPRRPARGTASSTARCWR